jgi:malonate transporter MadL subunit
MLVYGVAVLAGCFIAGQMVGEVLGRLLNIDANVGGVGFAMLLLIIINQWMHKRKLFSADMEKGVMFWSNMYIPVIVAMSAIQNVKAAVSSGMIAILAGIIPTIICFLLIPVISRISKNNEADTGMNSK